MATTRRQFSGLKLGITLLALATALIHLQLNFPDPMFILNGVAYLTLLGLYLFQPGFLGGLNRLVRPAFIAFTLLTIVLWVFLGRPYTTIGYVDKSIEVLLVVLLLLDRR